MHHTVSRLPLSLTLLLDIFGSGCFFTTWIVVISLYLFQREDLPAIITEIYNIHNHNDMVTNGRQYVVFILVMLVVNSIPRLYMLFINPDGLSLWINPLNALFYYIFTSIPVVVAGQYSVLLNFLSDQLLAITRQLKKSVFGLEVHHLVNTHHTLCILSKRLNKVYGSFLLQFLALQFMAVVIKLYIIIVFFTKPGTYSNGARLMNSLSALFISVGNIISVVTVAVGAADNVSSTLL